MATLVRWEPFREIAALQNEMSRFMNGLVEGNGKTTQSWLPTLDAWETENELVYAFDLPGVPEDRISVELDEGALTVSASRERTREVSGGGYHRSERRFGTFARTVGVPQGVTEADVTATVGDGVLELHVRKPELPKPRKIEVSRVASQPAQPTIEGEAEQA